MDSNSIQEQITLIPGVMGSNLTWNEEGSLTEVHVLADHTRKAREIMLDVKSLLSVVLQQQIDFRIISVAQVEAGKAQAAAATDAGKMARLHLSAAYVRRLPGIDAEGVVELRVGDEDIIGRSRCSVSPDSVTDSIAKAFAEAIRDLLPGKAVKSRVQFLSGYCIADVQLISAASGDTEDYVGAVRVSGDQPWDVCRAILASLNRKLEVLLQAM